MKNELLNSVQNKLVDKIQDIFRTIPDSKLTINNQYKNLQKRRSKLFSLPKQTLENLISLNTENRENFITEINKILSSTGRNTMLTPNSHNRGKKNVKHHTLKPPN